VRCGDATRKPREGNTGQNRERAISNRPDGRTLQASKITSMNHPVALRSTDRRQIGDEAITRLVQQDLSPVHREDEPYYIIQIFQILGVRRSNRIGTHPPRRR
jgi:hypothetical protein